MYNHLIYLFFCSLFVNLHASFCSCSSDYFEVILPEDIILTVVNLKIANVVQGPLSSSPVGTVKYFISEFLLKAGSST